MVAAERGGDAGLLVRAEGEALLVLIGDVAPEPHRVLRQRQQAAIERRHGDAGGGVQVDHAVRVGAGAMDRSVNGEAARVGDMAGVVDDTPVGVDRRRFDAVISSKVRPKGLIRKASRPSLPRPGKRNELWV